MSYLLRRPLLAGVLFFILLLIVRRALWGPPAPADGDLARKADGRAGVLRGVVLEPPQRRGPVTTFLVRATGWRESPWGDFSPAQGRVAVTLAGRPPSADWGDEALFWGRLKPLRGPAAPGGFDQRAVGAERRVFCRFSARPGGAQLWRAAARASPVWWAVQARRRCARAFARLSPEARVIAAGLVLGDRPSGHPQIEEDFRRGGAAHLLVASGSNVAFVLSLWWFLGRWVFGLRRKIVLSLAVPLAFFYGAVAGADPPVMRAAVMSAVGVTGLLLGRVDRPVHLLGTAALILLLIHPEGLFQAGFQMSFAAVLGLVWGMPAVEAALRWAAARGFRPRPKAAEFLLFSGARLLAASLASQLALAPLMIFYFRRFSVAGLWSNMVAVPGAGLCLFLGAALCLWDFCGVPGAGLAAALLEKAVLSLWKFVAWAGRGPGAEIFLTWTPAQTLALAAAAGATFFVLSTAKTRDPEEGIPPPPLGRRGLVFLLAVWATGGAAIFLLSPRGPREPLVLWPDVRGDAVVSLASDGTAAVADPASAEQLKRTILPFLREVRGTPRRIFFTRPPRGGAAALRAMADLSGAELRCSFADAPPPCADWPVGEVFTSSETAWRRSSAGVFSVEVGPARFLFLSDGKFPPPGGAWTAATLHPRGPERTLAKKWDTVRTERWVLQGRGGASWERTLPVPVHRPARDGYLLYRAGRWRSPYFVK